MSLRSNTTHRRRSSNMRVLVVEDEPLARRALTALLSASGYEVTGAASAEEALRDAVKTDPPHFALVDLNLPGMDGLEFISRLRQSTDFLPVLITASGSDEVAPRAHSENIVLMRKPLDYPRLVKFLSENATLH